MKFLALFTATIIFFISISTQANNTQPIESGQIQKKINNLEKTFAGKIGVYAIDTNNDQILAYRANERFPVQSTMKLIGVAALLNQSSSDKNLLAQTIYYTQNDLLPWSPVTRKYVNSGMSFAALAEAAISYSDNSAINLITKQLGGPLVITNFAHSIGNKSFNVEHYDGDLNSNPLNPQDTSTPYDMAISVQKLILGTSILTPQQKTQLVMWMRNNTTGYKRIRSGTPIGWVVADKTGSGDYGIANDIGILWSPVCKPIVLAIYTVRNQQDAKKRDYIVASTTNIIMATFAKADNCFLNH